MAPDDFRSLRSLHPSQPDGWAPPSNVAEGGHGLRRHQTFGRALTATEKISDVISTSDINLEFKANCKRGLKKKNNNNHWECPA